MIRNELYSGILIAISFILLGNKTFAQCDEQLIKSYHCDFVGKQDRINFYRKLDSLSINCFKEFFEESDLAVNNQDVDYFSYRLYNTHVKVDQIEARNIIDIVFSKKENLCEAQAIFKTIGRIGRRSYFSEKSKEVFMEYFNRVNEERGDFGSYLWLSAVIGSPEIEQLILSHMDKLRKEGITKERNGIEFWAYKIALARYGNIDAQTELYDLCIRTLESEEPAFLFSKINATELLMRIRTERSISKLVDLLFEDFTLPSSQRVNPIHYSPISTSKLYLAIECFPKEFRYRTYGSDEREKVKEWFRNNPDYVIVR